MIEKNQKPTVKIEGDIIFADALGEQNEDNAVYLYEQLKKAIEKYQNRGVKPKVVLDVSNLKLSKSSAGGREAYRKMARLNFAYAAVISRGSINVLANYLVKTLGMRDKVFFYKNKKSALKALEKLEETIKRHHDYTTLSLLGGIVLLCLAAITLAGFITGITQLATFVPDNRPINPLASISLLLLGLAVCFFHARLKRRRLYVVILASGSIFAAVLGLSGIDISIFFHNFDYSLYSTNHKFAIPGILSVIALATATITRVLYPTKQLNKKIFAVDLLVSLISFLSLYAILYGHLFISFQTSDYYMSVPLSLMLFLTASFNAARYINYRYVSFDDSLSNRNINYFIIFSIISIQVVLYLLINGAENSNIANQQQALKNQAVIIENKIGDRIHAYQDTLQSYRALFFSSQKVNEGEFQNFTDGIDVINRYPGFLVISYVHRVETNQLAEYVKERRADTSFDAKAAAKFSILNKSDSPVHYIYSYASNPPRNNIGIDLSVYADRTAVFEEAERTKSQVASETVDFDLGADGNNPGFFITVPVYSEGDRDVPEGFVNALLPYNQLMPNLFSDSNLTRDLNVTIKKDDQAIFHSSELESQNHNSAKFKLTFAGDEWEGQVEADNDFGLTSTEKNYPRFLFLTGQIITAVIFGILIYHAFSRKRMLLLAEDINQDLNIEKQRAINQKNRVDTILNNVGEGLITLDEDETIIYVNSVFTKLTGQDPNNVIGKKLTEVCPIYGPKGKAVDLNKKLWTKLKSSQSAQSVVTADDFWYQKANGDKFPVSLTLAPILKDREFIGAVQTFRDITKEKEVDKAKTEFVSLASHQLRTPLSTINWYSEMLLAGDAGKVTKDQKKYLEEIYNGNRRMTELIGSLLNVSRIDLGTFSVEPAPTDLIELSKNIVKDLEPRIFQRQIDFNENYDSTVPKLNVDPKIMRMIIENLASNSIKYTPSQGKVTLSITKQKNVVVIEVKDNGYGIPKTQQDKIFTKLFRADNVKAKDTEGTGLGLYLVKSLVEYSNGKIAFTSAEDKGTTFRVELPLAGMKPKEGSKKLD